MEKKVLSISEAEAIALQARQAALAVLKKQDCCFEAGQTDALGGVITQQRVARMCRQIDAACLQVLREAFVITEE